MIADFDTVYPYSMHDSSVECPICKSEHFKRVRTRLPSGLEREVKEFEACRRCGVVLYRPGQPVEIPASNISNYRHFVPVSIVDVICRALPDPNLETTSATQTQYYKHEQYGRLKLIFGKIEDVLGEERKLCWLLEDAQRLVE